MSEEQPKKKRLNIAPISRPALVFWIAWAAVIFIVGAVTIYFRCGPLARTLAERDALFAEMTKLEEQAKEADRLREEIKEFGQLEDTVLAICESRILWGEKLDQLVDIIPPYIRIKSLEARDINVFLADRGLPYPTIEMDCISDGTDARDISRFRLNIIKGPLWQDVYDMPEWPFDIGQDKDGHPVLKFRAVLYLGSRPHRRPMLRDFDKLPHVIQRRGRRDPFERASK
ncbi:MAG: hypothetical protein AB1696_23260 [Planctomycetota bacterium]